MLLTTKKFIHDLKHWHVSTMACTKGCWCVNINFTGSNAYYDVSKVCMPACRHIHLYGTLCRRAVIHLTAMYSGSYYGKPIFNYILNIPHKSMMLSSYCLWVFKGNIKDFFLLKFIFWINFMYIRIYVNTRLWHKL